MISKAESGCWDMHSVPVRVAAIITMIIIIILLVGVIAAIIPSAIIVVVVVVVVVVETVFATFATFIVKNGIDFLQSLWLAGYGRSACQHRHREWWWWCRC